MTNNKQDYSKFTDIFNEDHKCIEIKHKIQEKHTLLSKENVEKIYKAIKHQTTKLNQTVDLNLIDNVIDEEMIDAFCSDVYNYSDMTDLNSCIEIEPNLLQKLNESCAMLSVRKILPADEIKKVLLQYNLSPITIASFAMNRLYLYNNHQRLFKSRLPYNTSIHTRNEDKTPIEILWSYLASSVITMYTLDRFNKEMTVRNCDFHFSSNYGLALEKGDYLKNKEDKNTILTFNEKKYNVWLQFTHKEIHTEQDFEERLRIFNDDVLAEDSTIDVIIFIETNQTMNVNDWNFFIIENSPNNELTRKEITTRHGNKFKVKYLKNKFDRQFLNLEQFCNLLDMIGGRLYSNHKHMKYGYVSRNDDFSVERINYCKLLGKI